MNQLGKGQLAMLHTRFKAPEANGSEQEDFLIFMYFYGSNLGPAKAGPFWTRGDYLNKLGLGPLANATYQFQAPEPSICGEEDF